MKSILALLLNYLRLVPTATRVADKNCQKAPRKSGEFLYNRATYYTIVGEVSL